MSFFATANGDQLQSRHDSSRTGVPMSYVKSVLQPGEVVVMTGHLHWIAYWHAILFLIAGVGLLLVERAFASGDVLISITAVVFGALFLVSFLRAWFIRWITEIAVTNKRVIFKRGFINRHTAEMNMDKVASVDVDQSVMGRLLDYGTIHIIGTGGVAGGANIDSGLQSIEHIHRIANPIAFRNAITAK